MAVLEAAELVAETAVAARAAVAAVALLEVAKQVAKTGVAVWEARVAVGI